jgi:hypothetical protein
MKTFHLFLEHPHETNEPVPVTRYLPQAPNTAYQTIIPRLLEAIKNGDVLLVPDVVQLTRLIPTQVNVSRPKVERYLHINLSGEKPAVVLQYGPDYIIIDGHHRLCGEVLKGIVFSTVYVITQEDAARCLTPSYIDK